MRARLSGVLGEYMFLHPYRRPANFQPLPGSIWSAILWSFVLVFLFFFVFSRRGEENGRNRKIIKLPTKRYGTLVYGRGGGVIAVGKRGREGGRDRPS